GLVSGDGGHLLGWQALTALWVICFSAVGTFILLQLVKLFVPLRMDERDMEEGDLAVHGHEVYPSDVPSLAFPSGIPAAPSKRPVIRRGVCLSGAELRQRLAQGSGQLRPNLDGHQVGKLRRRGCIAERRHDSPATHGAHGRPRLIEPGTRWVGRLYRQHERSGRLGGWPVDRLDAQIAQCRHDRVAGCFRFG
ncbi:MAG: ammonium transporter, partial [Actinobacteria bacterium]